MSDVLLDGRKLPPGDWEGDDFTPGAGGKYVTCTDTALGRMIYYATNGRKVLDGRDVRKAVSPPDPNGITLPQLTQAAKSLGYGLLTPLWNWSQVLAHLSAKKGLILQGWYAAIPRAERFQLSANFGHAMWASHYSATSGIRVWDALDPNEAHHGSWVPALHVRAFLEEFARRTGSSHLLVAYVDLEPIGPVVTPPPAVATVDPVDAAVTNLNYALNVLKAGRPERAPAYIEKAIAALTGSNP